MATPQPASAAAARAAELESKVLESEFLQTTTGARVSRTAKLYGQKHLALARKVIVEEGTVLRADLGRINVGSHCVVGANTVLQPPRVYPDKGGIKFGKQTIRDHTIIGRDCVVYAASVGCGVRVGDGCVLGERCILHDCCEVKPGAVLPPDTVVPPFGVFAGCPATLVEERPASCADELKKEAATAFDERFG